MRFSWYFLISYNSQSQVVRQLMRQIIALRFTCGEKKNWENFKKSQSIMTMIVVWNYKRNDVITIRKALDLINWNFIFLNKIVHDNFLAFDQVINYVPKNVSPMMIKIPPWMNSTKNSKIQQKTLSLSNMLKTAKLHIITKIFSFQ